VLVVGGGDVSTLGTLQRIFSGMKVSEFEMAVAAGDHENFVFRVLDVLQRNTSAGKWTFAGADNGTGNAEMAEASRRHLRRCLRQERSGHREE
jgi:hypothetical protein